MSIQTAHDLRAVGDGFGKLIDRGDEPQGSVLGLLRDAKETIYAAADRLLALEQNAPENDPEFQKSVAEPPLPAPQPPGHHDAGPTAAPVPDKLNQPAGEAHPPADHAEAAPGKGKGGGKGDRTDR